MRFWDGKKVAGRPRLGFGVASYLNDDPRRAAALRCFVASLQAQSYANWRALVIHDGELRIDPDSAAMRYIDEVRQDERVAFVQTAERKKQYGHPWRQSAIEQLAKDCDWIVLTNEDNYYPPVFCEWMLSVGTTTKGCEIVFCDTVHSHRMWTHQDTELRLGAIDLGAVMVRADLASRVPFDNFGFKGDGHWINALVAASGPGHAHKVSACLQVHN